MTTTVSVPVLQAAMTRVLHTVADDLARPILTAMLFEKVDGGLRVVGADNYRIGIAEIRDVACDFDRLLVPREAAKRLIRALKEAKTGEVGIIAGDHKAIFSHDGTYDSWILTFREIDGQYPNYMQVVRSIEEDGQTIAINPRYLAEMGKVSDSPAVRVYVEDKLSPVVIWDKEAGYREIIMPVRLT